MLPSNVNPIEAKDKFAAALLRWPKQHFDAARAVFPNDMTAALFVMQEWPYDDYVIAKQKELRETHGDDAYLPTKYELAHDVYHLATSANDVESRIKAYKLFADIQGHVSKPTTNVNVNTQNIKQKVLVLRQYTDEQVEDAQFKLLAEMQQDAE